MTASVIRLSPIGTLSVPRIGAWSASLSIHLAIIALLLSAPAAIKLVRETKPDPTVVVRMIDPVKPIEVPPTPVPVIRHTVPAPMARHDPEVMAPAPTHAPIAEPAAPIDAPSLPVADIGTGVPTDVAPSAIGYGSTTKVPYPIDAIRHREQGTVILRVLVDADGKVLTVEIETSSGSTRLDRAARDAVKSWRFNPARHAGSAQSAWARVPVSFNLSTL